MWITTVSLALSLFTNPSPETKTYQSSVKEILQLKNTIQLSDSTTSKYQTYLDSLIVSSILPHWYGTPWDFDGYSNVPQKGQIACGYFVSTPLKHVGYNWNRFRLAQQDATTIIRRISGKNIKFYRNQSPSEFLNNVKKLDNGLYVLGLDSHVGFLYKTTNQIKIIHSSYYGEICVMEENAQTSLALQHSNSYVLGLLNTKENLQKWKNNTIFKI